MRSRAARWVVAAACAVALSGCSGAREVRPVPIPWSADDVDNPMRGQYVWDPHTQWSGPRTAKTSQPYPQSSANETTRKDHPWPNVSTYYTRVAWSDIEASDGDASGGFPKDSVLERRIADAASRGRRTIFRVVMLDETYASAPRRLYPDHLASSVREWEATSRSGRRLYVPDWNSPAYVAGVERLVAELGRRYDGDPRVAGFDVSGYGTWGERNDVGWGDRLPRGYERITARTTRRFVDAAVAAFPTTQLFVLTEPDVLEYGLAASPRMGIRFDCLGQWSGGGAFERMGVPGARDRWLTAPVATELCPANYGVEDAPAVAQKVPALAPDLLGDAKGDLYANARRQVARWHVSLVSSGNFPGAGNGEKMSTQQRRDTALAGKWAGYRYRVESATIRAEDDGVRVSTRWLNEGVAPAYSGPQVELQLRRKGTAQVVARVRSTIDLSGVVASVTPRAAKAPTPAGADATDLIPRAGVPSGSYDVVVVVRGTTSGVTAPLRLAQEGRVSNGGYLLSTVDL